MSRALKKNTRVNNKKQTTKIKDNKTYAVHTAKYLH